MISLDGQRATEALSYPMELTSGLRRAAIGAVYRHRRLVVLALQLGLFALAWWLAFAIRFDFAIPIGMRDALLTTLPLMLLLKAVTFKASHLYGGLWRYVSVGDLLRIIAATAVAGALFLAVLALWPALPTVPRSIVPLDFLLTVALVGGARVGVRVLRERFLPRRPTGEDGRKRILIVGAGEAGYQTLREIQHNGALDVDVVGFVDDDHRKRNASLLGVPILGTTREVCALAAAHDVDEVLIAIPSATGKEIRAIVERCDGEDVRFKILPAVGDLIAGKVSVRQFREVEIDDLLGRENVRLDMETICEELTDRTVLITGAGGSIGSELARQVLGYGPARLLLLDRNENALFHIDQELRERAEDPAQIVPIIGDLCDGELLREVFLTDRPSIVYHAAAYKHVPMMEGNVLEAVRNNVLGSWRLMEIARECAVDRFVLISTDKAVHPSNVMGATKRLAEMVLAEQNERADTRFVAVRFGNVLGSSGSVVPIFREQLKRGGPLTVTHPDVSRYFMTIPEAVQLVIQAGMMGRGGEVFLLDMGDPVRIVDLAEKLITLSGKKPYEDVDLVFTGLRPGEKLHEELYATDELILPTPHEKILVLGNGKVDAAALEACLDGLEEGIARRDGEGLRTLLFESVGEPLQDGKVLQMGQRVG